MSEYSYFKNLKDCLKKDPNHILRKAYSTYCCLGRSLIFLRSIPIINIFFSLSKHSFANPRDYFSLVTLDIITTKSLLTLKLTIHFIFCWVLFFSLLVLIFLSFLPIFSFPHSSHNFSEISFVKKHPNVSTVWYMIYDISWHDSDSVYKCAGVLSQMQSIRLYRCPSEHLYSLVVSFLDPIKWYFCVCECGSLWISRFKYLYLYLYFMRIQTVFENSIWTDPTQFSLNWSHSILSERT